MKKFFTQKINPSYAIITVLVLVLGVSQATAQYAQPGDVGSLNPLIHKGGGEQSISELRLGAGPGLDVGLDASGGVGFVSWFDNTGSNSAFATLQNTFLLGRVFIGQGASPTLNIWNTNQGTLANPLLAPLQKVNVYGNTLATNLQNTSGNAKVCVTNSGVLVLCPETTYYEYQCDYTTGTGQWQQPGYRAADGTDIGGGTIQGGVAVLDDCPAETNYGRLDAYNSLSSYTTGDRVCSDSLPSSINCSIATVPAFVCGGLTPGEWNPTGYGAQTCPYQNYSGTGLYNQGDIVCSTDGSTPSNGTCTAPAIPAYTCQSGGTWIETGYGAPTCPYSNYSGSVQYSNGNSVCSSTIPSNSNCTAASSGVCGLSDGGTFSSAPSNGLCASGTASVVNNNGPFNPPAYTWICSGSNGGSNDSCSANYQPAPVNAQCANFTGTYSTQPANSANGCIAGNYQDETDTSTTWDWSCQGINGGLAAICDAGKQLFGDSCPGVFPMSDLPVSPGGSACVSDGQGGCDCQSYQDTYDVCPSSCTLSTGGGGGGSTGGGSCGDSCSSNSDCQSGIFCYSGQCDMYDTNNNGVADDFDGIC